ncbi:MAG: hypothetical protein WC551_08370 [Patescibacteria group bacterium]
MKPPEMRFEGPCPFLFCQETGPHSHPVCPQCGGVNFGNIFCPTCQEIGLPDRLKAIQNLADRIKAIRQHRRIPQARATGRRRRFQPVPNTRPFSFSNQLYKKDVLGGVRELGPRVARKELHTWLTRDLHRIDCGTEYDLEPLYLDTRYPQKEDD